MKTFPPVHALAAPLVVLALAGSAAAAAPPVTAAPPAADRAATTIPSRPEEISSDAFAIE